MKSAKIKDKILRRVLLYLLLTDLPVPEAASLAELAAAGISGEADISEAFDLLFRLLDERGAELSAESKFAPAPKISRTPLAPAK